VATAMHNTFNIRLFKGFSGQFEDRTQRWIIFKKREMNLYPWYQLQDKDVKKE
jgi:hypothetical protein